MTNLDFADKCRWVATSVKTLYCRGGWGQPGTWANKQYFKLNYSFNRSDVTDGDGVTKNRANEIDKATADTFFMDCSCGTKSIIDGFSANKNQKFGGATYGKPCPDCTIESMLKDCTDISTDMKNIEIGEFLVYEDFSHCGVYLGNNEVFEVTYRWKDGAQITKLDDPARVNMWKKHGKLSKYMTYVKAETQPNVSDVAVHKSNLKTQLNNKIICKKGQSSELIKAMKVVLIDKGYKSVSAVDGYFGTDTENAIKDFQKKNGLVVDGIVGLDTFNKLLA